MLGYRFLFSFQSKPIEKGAGIERLHKFTELIIKLFELSYFILKRSERVYTLLSEHCEPSLRSATMFDAVFNEVFDSFYCILQHEDDYVKYVADKVPQKW